MTDMPTATAAPAVPVAELCAVSKSYKTAGGHDLKVLENIDLAVRPGELLALLGQSGSGKSTILRCLTGLVEPTSGRALRNGKLLQGINPDVSIVFQTFALYPWLTVEQNVAVGLMSRKMDRAEREAAVDHAIDLIGLGNYHAAYPRELSGGMRQRVGFARALVVDPMLMLMDEPFSALDVLTAETLRTDLLDLWTQGRLPIKSVLIVTHNIEEAVFMCDRILVLSSNPGRVIAEIKVPFKHPRNRLDPRFRQMVDDIYSRMTVRAATGKATVLSIGERLPEEADIAAQRVLA